MGLRELRRQASELVRQAEGGEAITVTVSGRPTAMLIGFAGRTWRRFDEIKDLFTEPADGAWSADSARLDDEVRDPWQG